MTRPLASSERGKLPTNLKLGDKAALRSHDHGPALPWPPLHATLWSFPPPVNNLYRGLATRLAHHRAFARGNEEQRAAPDRPKSSGGPLATRLVRARVRRSGHRLGEGGASCGALRQPVLVHHGSTGRARLPVLRAYGACALPAEIAFRVDGDA